MLLDVRGNAYDYDTDLSVFGNVFRFAVAVHPSTIRRGPSGTDATTRRGPSAIDRTIRRGPSETPDVIRRG